MDNWQDFLPPTAKAIENQRLRLLHDGAQKQLRTTESDLTLAQVDSAKGRLDFFDRLTIGAGAAITALVSFLGAHSTKLQPAWILRAALVSLVLTMLAALYRNFRYPNYVLLVHKISWMSAARYEQKCRFDCIRADPTAVSFQTGGNIGSDAIKDSEKSVEDVAQVIKEHNVKSERLRKEWTCAQYLCMSFAALAMIFLVWLALANF